MGEWYGSLQPLIVPLNEGIVHKCPKKRLDFVTFQKRLKGLYNEFAFRMPSDVG